MIRAYTTEQFLSTPSARRATRHRRAHHVHRPISIHALREVGDLQPCKNRHFAGLFLSTPSARRATRSIVEPDQTEKFLSTPSARRATLFGGVHFAAIAAISIHALREEGDTKFSKKSVSFSNFYPRPPRGGRQSGLPFSDSFTRFLSTPSARRATTPFRSSGKALLISIHALREEGDWSSRSADMISSNFYPRPPRGGRRFPGHDHCAGDEISIHALREEGDLPPPAASRAAPDFYPRPPRGGRLANGITAALPYVISIHALREEGDGCHPEILV